MNADTIIEEPKTVSQTGGVSEAISEDILEVNKLDEAEDAKRRYRARNYSFAGKLSDPQRAAKFETVEVDGVEISVPATIGSTYWAILRIMYEHANKPVYPDVLVKKVKELMEDAFPDRWDAYTGKAETTVFRRVEQKRDRQPIKTWKDRIINNTKTLTRVGGIAKYGLRLQERGHLLRYEYDSNRKPCFVLHTSLDSVKKSPNQVKENDVK